MLLRGPACLTLRVSDCFTLSLRCEGPVRRRKSTHFLSMIRRLAERGQAASGEHLFTIHSIRQVVPLQWQRVALFPDQSARHAVPIIQTRSLS